MTSSPALDALVFVDGGGRAAAQPPGGMRTLTPCPDPYCTMAAPPLLPPPRTRPFRCREQAQLAACARLGAQRARRIFVRLSSLSPNTNLLICMLQASSGCVLQVCASWMRGPTASWIECKSGWAPCCGCKEAAQEPLGVAAQSATPGIGKEEAEGVSVFS